MARPLVFGSPETAFLAVPAAAFQDRVWYEGERLTKKKTYWSNDTIYCDVTVLGREDTAISPLITVEAVFKWVWNESKQRWGVARHDHAPGLIRPGLYHLICEDLEAHFIRMGGKT